MKNHEDLEKLAKMIKELSDHKKKHHLKDTNNELLTVAQSYHHGMLAGYEKVLELIYLKWNIINET